LKPSSAPSCCTGLRQGNPEVVVHVRQADLTDPTAGLRAGLADVALTRTPFDRTGIRTRTLRSDVMGVVLRADDPLASSDTLHLHDLNSRPWFQLPEGTDPLWRAYWSGTVPGEPVREGPVVRTVAECVQGVLWNGTTGIAPLSHALPPGLAMVPLADMPPSRLVVAWSSTDANPLIRSFIKVATMAYRSHVA
jgi:DNA-binding transcriptional LysR family regulator